MHKKILMSLPVSTSPRLKKIVYLKMGIKVIPNRGNSIKGSRLQELDLLK
jgi:hypothetical protein